MANTTNTRAPLGTFTLPILEEMKNILKDRGVSYSDFEDNTSVWYGVMNALGLAPELPKGMTKTQYCGLAYMAMKMSRLAVSPGHHDSWLDAANYSVLTAGVNGRTELAKEPQPMDADDPSPRPYSRVIVWSSEEREGLNRLFREIELSVARSGDKMHAMRRIAMGI